MQINTEWKDYEIIATGNGEKLERWGNVKLLRPDPQVIWPAQKTFQKKKDLTQDMFENQQAAAIGKIFCQCQTNGKFLGETLNFLLNQWDLNTLGFSQNKLLTGQK